MGIAVHRVLGYLGKTAKAHELQRLAEGARRVFRDAAAYARDFPKLAGASGIGLCGGFFLGKHRVAFADADDRAQHDDRAFPEIRF